MVYNLCHEKENRPPIAIAPLPGPALLRRQALDILLERGFLLGALLLFGKLLKPIAVFLERVILRLQRIIIAGQA